MKTQELRSMSVAAALAALAAVSSASAQTLTVPCPNRVISWNLDDTSTVNPGDLAGLAPAVNWVDTWLNNVTIGLPDNTGTATTLDLGYRGFNSYHVVGSHPGLDANGTANREMLNGYLNAGPAAWNPPVTNTYVSLTNIPYARYDVIVYFNSDTSGRKGTIDNGSIAYNFSTVAAPSVSGANALFLPTTVTNGSTFPSANFALFPGMTAPNAIFTEKPKSGNDQWLGIAAFQVIESSNVFVVYGPAPATQTVPLGQPASFSVMAGGLDPQFQWRHDGTPIPNATNASYSIASTAVGQNGNYDVVITNSFSSVTSSVATLTFYTPRTLRWSGIGSDWDTTSQNWTANNGSSTTAYIETDIVRFDPLGIAQSSVNLTGSRTPSAIIVSNASYTLSGGSIDGSGSLSIVNNGALVLSTADNGNGFINIASGSSLEVNVGGVLGSGALTNNGALIFNLSSDQAYGYPIYGAGSITNRGSTGRITLGGNVAATYLVQEGPNELLLQGQNSLSGGLRVLSGLAIARSEGAFGGGATILSGGELNIPFSFNFTGGSLTLAGGTLTSDGTTSFDGPVSLTVDSTITARGADLVLSNAAGISGAGFMLTKTGNGVLTLAGTTNRWSELVVSAGTLRIGAGGTTGGLGSGSAQLSGALDFNLSGDITVTNAISGGGFITHNGSGSTTLTGDENAFVGAINVTNGTLRLNVTSAASAATVAGGALGGSGSISGNVDVLAGGALAPGSGVGTFTIQGSLNLGGNLQIDVNRSLAQSNDLIVVNGSLNSTSTGTVIVNNLGPALAAGNSFKLFNQPLPGGETLTVSGAGAVWTNKLATDGTIQVLSTSVPQPRIVTTTVVANQIIFSGTNGLANGGYQVLSSTNIATPLANWISVASGSFNGTGQFSITNAISPNEPQRFYLLKVQ